MWKTERPPRKGNYLHGSFIKLPEVDGYIQSVNPGNTRDQLGQFPYSLGSVDFAVECARSVQGRWHRTALGNRKLLLERYADALMGMKEALIAMIVREVGKPEWEADLELKATIKYIELVLEEGPSGLDPHHVPELDAMTERHPWGVCAVLGAFDRPLLSPNAHMVPALLAGNTVVFKPSRYAPVVGQLLAEAIDRAKFPRGVVNMVQGRGRQVGERLVAHPDVDAVMMHGADATARRIRRNLIDQPWKQLFCNTCSRGTAIVLDDAELDKAVYELVLGAYLTTGQRRSSTCRVLVTSRIADALIQRLTGVTNRLGIGYGFDDDVFMGPITSKRVRRRFLEFLQASVNAGMDLLTPSYPVEHHLPGYYVHPAVLYGSSLHLEREETSEHILGPVLEIYVVRDFAEAVELHNRSRNTAVTALFTRTVDYLHEARYLLRSQVINFNCSTVHLSSRLPLPGQERTEPRIGLATTLRRTARDVALYQDRKAFNPLSLLPGVRWPEVPTAEEAPAEDDEADETTLIIDPDPTVEVPLPTEARVMPRIAVALGPEAGLPDDGEPFNVEDFARAKPADEAPR